MSCQPPGEDRRRRPPHSWDLRLRLSGFSTGRGTRRSVAPWFRLSGDRDSRPVRSPESRLLWRKAGSPLAPAQSAVDLADLRSSTYESRPIPVGRNSLSGIAKLLPLIVSVNREIPYVVSPAMTRLVPR